MDAIINGADELYNFRQLLIETIDCIKDKSEKMEQWADDLERKWDDNQGKKFLSQFAECKEELQPLCEKIEEYEKNLNDREQLIRDKYLTIVL